MQRRRWEPGRQRPLSWNWSVKKKKREEEERIHRRRESRMSESNTCRRTVWKGEEWAGRRRSWSSIQEEACCSPTAPHQHLDHCLLAPYQQWQYHLLLPLSWLPLYLYNSYLAWPPSDEAGRLLTNIARHLSESEGNMQRCFNILQLSISASLSGNSLVRPWLTPPSIHLCTLLFLCSRLKNPAHGIQRISQRVRIVARVHYLN